MHVCESATFNMCCSIFSRAHRKFTSTRDSSILSVKMDAKFGGDDDPWHAAGMVSEQEAANIDISARTGFVEMPPLGPCVVCLKSHEDLCF